MLKPDLKLPQNILPLPTEGFADDLLAFTPCTQAALHCLKSILTSFTNTSCLQLNIRKTEVMAISPICRESANKIVNEIGFRVSEQISHLGLTFDHKLERTSENWSNKIEKIKKCKNFFNSLRPDLCTKIQMVKTYFLSQLSYIAPVFSPSVAQLAELRDIFIKFLFPYRNTFPVLRIFLPSDQGGLGIPDPQDFINCLTLKFIFRSISSDQPWALCLKAFFPQENITLSSLTTNQQYLPPPPSRIGFFVKLLDDFHIKFYKYNDNIFYAPIFLSASIISPTSNCPLINPPHSFLGHPVASIKLGDCVDFSNKKILSFGQLTAKLQHQMTYNEYFLIYSIVRKNTAHLQIPSSRPPPVSLSYLFTKNPSTKYIRRTISDKMEAFENLPCVNFFNIYCRSDFNYLQTRHFMTVWNFSYLPSEIRNFSLLRSNNKLILNKQRAMFSNVSSICSFCKFFPLTIINAETPEHLFFSCISTYSLIDLYFSNFFDNQDIDWKVYFFKGSTNVEAKIRAYLNVEITLFCHYIFETKNLNKLPTFTSLLYHMSFIKKYLMNSSQKYRDIISYACKNYTGNHLNHLKVLENIPH